MPRLPSRIEIRQAVPAEFERLRAIESEADGMFAEVGIGPFTIDDAENHLAQAAAVLVAGVPAVVRRAIPRPEIGSGTPVA